MNKTRFKFCAVLFCALTAILFVGEAKAVTIYYVTTSNGLGSFDSSNPGAVTGIGAISGMVGAGEFIRGIDMRPATGQFYGISDQNRIYLISKQTAVATPVGGGAPFTPAINCSMPGFDFNPVADRIRVVCGNNANLRVNPDTGQVVGNDGNTAYVAGDVNQGRTPNLVGSLYTNNRSGATTTALYHIDVARNSLVRQEPPNSGNLMTVGLLTGSALTNAALGFDYSSTTNTAYLAYTFETNSFLYTVNLDTGAATFVGSIGTANINVGGIAAETAGPTAATVSASGRVVKAKGAGGISNASVTIFNATTGAEQTVRTNAFGYFSFAELPAGNLYIFSVRHKRYRFEPQVLQMLESHDDLIFMNIDDGIF